MVDGKKVKKPRCHFRDGETKCRKKTHLDGYQCDCGKVFCSSHRYPEKHNCTFDFKTKAKNVMVMANPRVKAEKVIKI